ncbi:GMC oxidoreductase [Methylophilaceae bacterium]|nr:GMC oxidoreductase [Methylophilaceae bacterium]
MDFKKGRPLIFYDINNSLDLSKDNQVYDTCIIGAGAAGITLALDLEKKGFKVALCEAGNFEYSEISQDSYKGKIAADPYLPLDTARLRFLGGSTNHWAGWCRPFESIDFNRGYMGEHFRWPIAYADIFAYRDRACEILEIPNKFEANDRNMTKDIKKIDFQFSPPVRFGSKYKNILAKSDSIKVFLNANLVGLEGTKGNITSAKFMNYKNKSIFIKSKKFIFSMGGIENSRFLLWFSRLYGNKFFNTSTPIGEYWMEHPHFTVGRAIVNKTVLKYPFYATTQIAQKDLNILGCGLRVEPLEHSGAKKLFNDLMCSAPSISRKLINPDLVCGVKFRSAWEQAPEKNNKILLSDEKDNFDVNRPILFWKKNNIDRTTLVDSINRFNDWVLMKNLGRIKLEDWVLNNEEYPEKDELAGYHHMGGTRMHNLEEYGVVDKNCKVYGSKNLYMAGSSVFTTGGYNNPTLPIIQLTLRLADHLVSITN